MDELIIHAGANIDPELKEDLKDPSKRNCAEKQAALSALNSDQVCNQKLKTMFLYRQKNGRELSAEKLLPCIDCYKNYIVDLMRNGGQLVLIIDEQRERNFYQDGIIASNTIELFEHKDLKSYYKIFQAQDLEHINVEKNLGSRVLDTN